MLTSLFGIRAIRVELLPVCTECKNRLRNGRQSLEKCISLSQSHWESSDILLVRVALLFVSSGESERSTMWRSSFHWCGNRLFSGARGTTRTCFLGVREELPGKQTSWLRLLVLGSRNPLLSAMLMKGASMFWLMRGADASTAPLHYKHDPSNDTGLKERSPNEYLLSCFNWHEEPLLAISNLVGIERLDWKIESCTLNNCYFTGKGDARINCFYKLPTITVYLFKNCNFSRSLWRILLNVTTSVTK
jgi:hypothetical protein